MSVVSLITALAQNDIRLWLEDGNLRYSAPDGAMTPELIQNIRNAKADIITFLQQSALKPSSDLPIADRSLPQEASFAQQRLWFIHQLNPQSSAYHIHVAFSIKGILNCTTLSRACSEIIRRHEILRTRYQQVDGKILQLIDEPSNFTIQASTIASADLDAALEQERNTPFSLDGQLFRARAWQLQENQFALAFTIHHIAADGWSLGIFVNELVQLYAAFSQGKASPLSDLPRQYVDYALWQQQNSQQHEQQLQYWQQELLHTPNLSLPYETIPSVNHDNSGASLQCELPPLLVQQLRTLNKTTGNTLFMTLLAAFSIVLERYSQQHDFCIGTPIAGRSNSQLESLIGCFINVLAIRCKPQPDMQVSKYLQTIKETCTKAFSQQDVPFEQIVQALNIDRDLAVNPVFQVMLSIQNAPFANLQSLDGLHFEALEASEPAAQIDLNLTAAEHSKGITLRLGYKKSLFSENTIHQLSQHLLRTIELICQHPQEYIGSLSIVRLEENVSPSQLTSIELDPRPVHNVISDIAQQAGTRIALESLDIKMTYSELDQRTNTLAQCLLAQNIGTGDFVGVYCHRGINMVISMLAILKAGAAFIPIDPDFPKDRTHTIIKNSKAKLVLSQSDLSLKLAEYPVLNIDDLPELTDAFALPDCQAHDAAYVIYTSGSTGIPKGVVIEHGALSNHMQWMLAQFNFTQEDRFLQKTPFVFDAAMWEFFAPLMLGASMILAPQDAHKQADKLNQCIADSRISVAQFVPSLLHACIQLLEPQQWRSLRYLFSGGEALSPALVKEIYTQLPEGKLINLYGPTETTIDASFSYCSTHDDTVTIGQPISNLAFFVLDQQHKLLPKGVAGELYIAGKGLARGYLHQDELSAQHFINNPFAAAPFQRLYKTGDRVKLREDGQYDYLGRIDHQLKIRGLRIESGEIEQRLLSLPGIDECLVCAINKDGESDNQHLVAYFTRHGHPYTSQQLRKLLLAQLPSYMIPSYFVEIKQWPLNHNGKIDRKLLPAPNWSELNRAAYAAPINSTQESLCHIWQDVLRIEKVGIHDNFFELGGHSLSATQALAKAQSAFAIELPLRDIFENPTIEAIAELIDIALLEKAVFANENQADDDSESFIL